MPTRQRALSCRYSATDGNGIGSQYANLAAGGISGDASGRSFSAIEAFIGSNFARHRRRRLHRHDLLAWRRQRHFDPTAYNVADIVYGGDGNDTMWTGEGTITLYGGAGDDALNGEAGIDTAFYSDATFRRHREPGNHSAQNTGGAGTDTLPPSKISMAPASANTLTGTQGQHHLGRCRQ